MTGSRSSATTRNSKLIKAPREAVYQAFTDPAALAAITFDSDDPAFSGEMIMEVTFEAEEEGTTVTILFKDIPSGIRPEDNETGTELSLEKLDRYVSDSALL